jgi:hypothetical protein
MRSSIKDNSLYTDDELNACVASLSIFFQMINDVPVFLPEREQLSYFANMVGCFVIPNMINSGFINPSMSEQLSSTLEAESNIRMAANNSSSMAASQTDDGEDEFVVVNKKTVN